MRTNVLSILMLIGALVSFASCSKEDYKNAPETPVTKVADYLYEYTAEGYGTEAPAVLYTDNAEINVFGCSAVRNGNQSFGKSLQLLIAVFNGHNWPPCMRLKILRNGI